MTLKSDVKTMLDEMLKQPAVYQYLEQKLCRENAEQQNPFLDFAGPGHFYSPLPGENDIAFAAKFHGYPFHDGIDYRLEHQRQFLRELGKFAGGYVWPAEKGTEYRYWYGEQNTYFGLADSFFLYAIIMHFAPKRVLEIGSGFSSAIMLDLREAPHDRSFQLTFIEPYPENRLDRLMRGDDHQSVEVIKEFVQNVSQERFEALEAGDILFIDSSHVSKIGSDVNYLFFEVFPRLKSGVVIHVHDIAPGWDYPLSWLRSGRAWNESYLLRSFLQFNTQFEILMFDALILEYFSDDVREEVPLLAPFLGIDHGSSFWMQKC